ncbi:hypothetical protein ANANG_G00009160 [Anguilla anguilla]|uniref:G patch domain-containing protein 4 n=1 Tax=Anguilla anguilla TaxID=7936 RepID=A0A9D3MX57_ANGAN|nr:hypothetical protein ANANG_G00009160 [Anguilla anguilla]
MAGAVEEKSRGLKFAEQQLIRHGWEQGKGLGRDGNGISEAIKVKVKCDKGGVGHSQGEQFTFHWWDHIFNKASSNLVVESGQEGIKVKKVTGEEEEGVISNKKPRKAELAKAKLYGRFVKSGTLWSGEEQTEKQSSSSEDSSESEDEDQRLDLSSTTKLSDADLVKACGGRTAHKGARHGLTMCAKLARLEQQELEFMEKYGKKSQTAKTISTETASNSAAHSPTGGGPEGDEGKGKKTKKKKKKSSEDKAERMLTEDRQTAPLPETDGPPIVAQKRKKRSKETRETVGEGPSSIPSSPRKSCKKKRRSFEEKTSIEVRENCGSEYEVKEDYVKEGSKGGEKAFTEQRGEHALIPEVNHDKNVPKKKKRSKNKVVASVATEGDCSNDAESNMTETVRKKKRKVSSDASILQLEQEEEQNTQQAQKKKKKTRKGQEKVEDEGRDETRAVKKKKKKRSCEPEHD